MDDATITKSTVKGHRFRRLAEKRVSAVIGMIRKIGDLSNSAAYAYEQQQIVKIFETMRDELDVAEVRFTRSAPSLPPVFTLD